MSTSPVASRAVNQKAFRRLGYLLVFLMMTCGLLTLATLLQSVAPGWHAGILAFFLLFIVADRLFTHGKFKSLTPLSAEWLLAHGAQWVVIAVLLRLLLSYAGGPASFRIDLSRLARGDLLALLTPEFVFSLVLGFLVWSTTGHFLSLLDEMGLDQTIALQEEPVRLRSDELPASQRLLNATFSMGIVLVVLTALARIDLRTVLPGPNGAPGLELRPLSGGEAGALLYFVFGLALLSLGRLLSLQTRWLKQRIPVSSANLTRQWAVYSVLFLLILAVFVSLLPAGDSIGFFSVLGALLGFLIGIFMFVGQLILVLVSLLLTLPMRLLRGEAVHDQPAPPPLPTMPPVDPVASAPPHEAWLLLRSILLWGSVAVIVIFAFIGFIRQHGGVRLAFSRSRLTNWLILAWQWLYRSAGATRLNLSRLALEGWQRIVSRREASRLLSRPGWINLRSLEPRRRIFFFYHAMLRRAEEQGLRRKPSQTPAEYASILERALPSAEDDIAALTEAFVEARYSDRAVGSGRAEAIQAVWGRIRGAFKLKRKREQNAKDGPR